LGWKPRLSVHRGPVVGGGASRGPACGPSCTGSGSVYIRAPGGGRGASPASPCTSSFTGPGSVAGGATGLSPRAGPSEGGPACGWGPELDCAAFRGWTRVRSVAGVGGPSEEGWSLVANHVVGAPPVGPAGWKRCTSRLRSTFPGRLPKGSVSVWRCADMSCAPGFAPRGGSGPGGGLDGRVGRAGGGVRDCNPSRESISKAHVRHLGAGIRSVPPRR